MSTTLIEAYFIAQAENLGEFQAAVMQHPAWCDRHPSGFGIVASIEDGEVFWYDPEMIAATTQHLDVAYGLADYLNAILCWWAWSTPWFTFHNAAPAWAVIQFAHEFPQEFGMFVTHPMVMAGQRSLVEWMVGR